MKFLSMKIKQIKNDEPPRKFIDEIKFDEKYFIGGVLAYFGKEVPFREQ